MTYPWKNDWQDQGPGVDQEDYEVDADQLNALAALVNGKKGYFQMISAVTGGVAKTITHNLNAPFVKPSIVRSYLHTGGLTSALVNEEIGFKWRRNAADPGNAIDILSDDDWADNEFYIYIEPVRPASLGAAPTAGVLSSTTQGLTSITLSLAGGTASNPDLAGVKWYRNGVEIGDTAGSTFEHTGLTQNTEYDGYTARRYNLVGTLGAVSNTLDNTFTLAPAGVNAIGTRVTNRDAADGNVSVDWAAAAGGNRLAVARVAVSHNTWLAHFNYDTLSVVGSVTGAWTLLSIDHQWADWGGAFNQDAGAILLFYIKESAVASFVASDPDDTETLTFTAADGAATFNSAIIVVDQFSGVDQTTPFGTVAGIAQNGPGTVTVASAADEIVLFGFQTFDAITAGSFNRTTDYVSPAAASGNAKYALFGRHAGAAPNVGGTLTWSGGSHGVGWGVSVKKAA